MKNDDCFTGNTSKFNEPSSSRDELQGLCNEVGFSDNPKSDFVPVIIDVLTLFPEIFTPLSSGIMKRARDNGLIELKIHNIRDYTTDKHGKCDDYAFGGGAGMVMTPQPIVDAIRSVDPNHESKRIFLSPRGRQFNQSIVTELAQYQRLLFLCGHYEGGSTRDRRIYRRRNLDRRLRPDGRRAAGDGRNRGAEPLRPGRAAQRGLHQGGILRREPPRVPAVHASRRF